MKKFLSFLALVTVVASWNQTAGAYGYMPPASGQITATPSTIQPGQAVTLSWTTSGAASVSISGIGAVNTQGSIVVYPQSTTAYTLSATNSIGAVFTVSATVNVQANCPGNESFVSVQLVSASTDTVIGGLEDGGSSGWSTQPFQTTNVSLAANSPNLVVNLQAYEQTGIPYPQSYHNISFQCTGSFNYYGTCNPVWPSVGPTVASVIISESSPGQFSCTVSPIAQYSK